MRTLTKVLLVTLAVAIPAFMLAPQTPLGAALWPEPKHDAVPTPDQVPFFMILGLMEAVTFGLAVAFLVLGWPFTKRLAAGTRLALPLHLAIAWVFGNFWLHDNVHYINGMDLAGLLVIDYVFHVTLMLAGTFTAYAVVRLAKRGPDRAAAGEDARTAAALTRA